MWRPPDRRATSHPWKRVQEAISQGYSALPHTHTYTHLHAHAPTHARTCAYLEATPSTAGG